MYYVRNVLLSNIAMVSNANVKVAATLNFLKYFIGNN